MWLQMWFYRCELCGYEAHRALGIRMDLRMSLRTDVSMSLSGEGGGYSRLVMRCDPRLAWVWVCKASPNRDR